MRLKRVQIFGFKTFADKTEFDIDADLIAVVGPNGCGKSNIVDAILWGLGETKASQLRAKTAQDVIFAGSNRRRRLGYAEVVLLFDNEDGTLPIDSPEVSVTRRLTRGGDSHYRINGRTCRLRDVNDLLADSGMGRAGYAIVGQQEIDQALAASAQQRREWIDEAAGVMRYRARRVESLRRLQAADEHLDRVGDIVREIEVQRSPLEREAEVAREYKQVRSSLSKVESGLLVNEIAAAVAKLEELDERLKSSAKIAEDEAARAEKLELEASGVTDKLADVEERIDGLRQEHHNAQTAFEQASAALQVAQSKLENLELLESTMSVEAVAGQERVAQADGDLSKAVADEETEAKALDQLRAEVSGADADARKLTQDLRSSETELFKHRELATQSQRIQLEVEHRQVRIESIDEEVRGIAAAIPDLQKAIKEAGATFGDLDAAMKAAKDTIRAADQVLAQLRKDEERHASAVRELLGEVAVLEGRKKGIQATIDAHDGLTQGALAVLRAVAEGTLKGKYAPVGESITVEPEYALAIDTVLGPAANDLMVAKESDAKRAIALLKDGKLGRATFQPISLMKPPSTAGLSKLLGEPGVVGIASQMVECDDVYRPVIDALLGSVLVTQDLETSLRISKTGGRRRLVSLEGEVVHASGAVTGGRSADHTAGIVQRKAEATEIEAKVSSLQKKLEALQSEHSGHEKAAAEQTEKLESAREELEGMATEHDESREWALNLRHELQATERAREKLKSERDALAATKDKALAKFDEKAAEDRRDGLLKQLAAKSAGADQAGQRLKEAESRAMQASSRRIEADRRRMSLAESEETREKRAENIGPNRDRYHGQIEQATKDRADTEAGARKYRKMLDEATSGKKELIASNIALSEAAREAQKTARSMSEQAHSAEIKRTRLDSRRTNAVQRLLEEYGLGQDDAIRLAPETEVPEDAAKLVPQLRKELKAMGDVNLGAIEAYDRLTERYDELTHQRDDILAGKAEIMESISELDKLTGERFATTFAALQVAFSEMFEKMFGGGQGEISLMDSPTDLDAGVEISVTVPGKKKQRLELLSGGERALSAIAFLFALLKVKPSPLVILDEVDAPLDGTNVERFVKVVREFCERSQFILITHNAVTMEEADVWFGVTMQEPGVSTLIPIKLPQRGLIERQLPEPGKNGSGEAPPSKAYVEV